MTFPRAKRFLPALLLVSLASTAAVTQQQSAAPQPVVAAPPQLSPRAAYDDALHPLDETRRSVSNWSPAEISALTITLKRAREACQARDAHAYSGSDLIEFARLCALGQEWGSVVLASTLYIDEPLAAKPQLAEAHAARVDADLHLRSEPDALRDAHAMFAAVPYSPIVAEASTEAIEYMRFSSPEDAIALATEREPIILKELQTLQAPAAVVSSPTPVADSAAPRNDILPSPKSAQSIHELYAQGIALATLLQQADHTSSAETAVAELNAALPAKLLPDDSLRIADDRRRYALLGKTLPALTLNRSLSMPTNIMPAIPAINTVTALLLFPDWCAQCITSMSQLPETVAAVEGHSAYYYGLLAETVPEKAPTTNQSRSELASTFQPGYAAALLAERPVLTVPVSTTGVFAADDFPFLIVTDTKGVVRVAQPVDADDLNTGGKVDAAVLLVSKHWPFPSATPSPAPAGTSARSSAKHGSSN